MGLLKIQIKVDSKEMDWTFVPYSLVLHQNVMIFTVKFNFAVLHQNQNLKKKKKKLGWVLGKTQAA